MMQALDKDLRRALEKTVKEARSIAEAAARAALEQLGVKEAAPFAHLSEEERELRRRLRAHGRQLGDALNGGSVQSMDALVHEMAYEHWHRMLFARFLAENNLLMYDGVAVTIEECDELAPDDGAKSGWELASKLAAHMLPQVFKPGSPVFELTFAPEHQNELERLLKDLPDAVFKASDSLGWVYQFWQADNKDRINKSEVKIGADELPAVTQLFTEPYMVAFLLDNSLGAWWASRRLTEDDFRHAQGEEALRGKAALPGVPLKYLRFVKTEVEAASCRFSEKRQDVASTIGYFDKHETVAMLSGNLPHWRQEGVTYFVTFRTADSMPQAKLQQWRAEKEEWLRQHPEPHDAETRQEYYEKFPARFQRWLDQGYGACLLRQPEYKAIVQDALKYFDGKRYSLDAFVVMPNHVHVVVTPLHGHELSDILQSWKSFTANEINKKAGKTGTFWQKESFDHIVRSPDQLERIRLYIENQDVEAASCRSPETVEAASCRSPETEKRQDVASTTRWFPAAETFPSWPERLAELKMLDPCCGSGHFLVAALLMLVPMRMELEGLSAREAVDAVLRDNLHGLELDERCVELAAFALALAAWTYPGAGGYRPLPELNLACSGLAVRAAREEWKSLGLGKGNLPIALDWLHKTFRDAPTLGSLLDPAGTDAAKLVQWEELSDALEQALKLELEPEAERRELAVAAKGLAIAAHLLGRRYHLVATNVPYLARGKQDKTLREFCEQRYPAAKSDLATVFLQRCLNLCAEGGASCVVLPQNWLFLSSYKKFREQLLNQHTWHLVARLGEGGFESSAAAGAFVAMLIISRGVEAASCRFTLERQDAASAADNMISGLDVSERRVAADKAEGLLTDEIRRVAQTKQLENPDARVMFEAQSLVTTLNKYAYHNLGICTGDSIRFYRKFWEFADRPTGWNWMQSTVEISKNFDGCESLVYWEEGVGVLYNFVVEKLGVDQVGSWLRGRNAWGKHGVLISAMRELPATSYLGGLFDENAVVVVCEEQKIVPALWCYCSDPSYSIEVRKANRTLKVRGDLVKVPFDLARWQKVAAEQYPHGLPQPYSDDPTQWIFHGHPCGSVIWNEQTKRLEVASTLRTDAAVLQVAVARLLGYRWPAELDEGMELAEEQREWVRRCAELDKFADQDGIVCIPPVRGEAAAADRLLNLLAAAYGDAWNSDTLSALLAAADHSGKSLETWLRDKFFAQHCKLFQSRPFIWHIWDGLRDGFSALVNYHRLDHKNLETLIYTYLGDWIARQKQDIAAGVDGAQERLAAAEALKKRLELILEGEAPHDIFVRWKPLERQPIGWEPDLNDGVRLNIRPFMSVPDVKKAGAGVLRDKPNIKWDKDRGKDVASAPWFLVFHGDRINDHHLTLAEKQEARARKGA